MGLESREGVCQAGRMWKLQPQPPEFRSGLAGEEETLSLGFPRQWDLPTPGLDASFLVTLGFGVHALPRSRQQGMGKGGGRQQS